jgi:ABC-type lipoprotein export system ATPase subunit
MLKKEVVMFITVKNLAKYYKSEETVNQALNNINLGFELGEFVAITGESGSGKTTLLNVLSGLDSYEDGELTIEGEETSAFDASDWELYRKQFVSFVFQSYNLIDSYSVYENIDMALKLNHYPEAKRKERVLELINQVGLNDHIKQKAAKLSGGQKQRVSIARALAKDAPILVADEPTGNLDQTTAKNIIELLKNVAKDKLVLVVTHEFNLVKEVATRRLRLFDGEVVEDKTLASFDKGSFNEPSLKGLNLLQKLNIAFKNLITTPRKTLLMALISIFIVGVFSLSYGSYVQQTSNAAGLFHPYFRNLHPSRIVVTKLDSGPISEANIQELKAHPKVKNVVRNDVILELYGLDQLSESEFGFIDYQAFSFLPGDSLSSSDIVSGRLPESMNEVVVPRAIPFSNAEYSIGDTFELIISNTDYIWREMNANYSMTVEVVGFHNDLSSNRAPYLIVNDDFFESDSVLEVMYQNLLSYQLKKDELKINEIYDIHYHHALDANQIYIDSNMYSQFAFELGLPETYEEALGETIELLIKHPFIDEMISIEVTLVDLDMSNQEYFKSIIISPGIFSNEAFNDLYQVALIVEDGFSASEVMRDFNEDYLLIYPAGYQDQFNEIFSVIGNILQAASSIFLLVVMYFIAYIALRNVMRSKERNTLILRSIGAYRKDLYQISIFELMMTMSVALIFVFGLLWLNQNYLLWVTDYLRFFTISNYIVMILLLLAMSVLLGRRFNKKLYTQSVMSALREA